MLYDVKIDTRVLSTGKILTWYEAMSTDGLSYRASQLGAAMVIWYRRDSSLKWKRSRMLPDRFLALCERSAILP